MRVAFRPEARVEAHEAQAWYETRAAGLGTEFARAVDAAMASATRSPLAYGTVTNGCRRILLRRFPYSLVYRVRDDEILVVAVFHHRRDPSVLTRRSRD